MATRYPESIEVTLFESIAIEINQSIDKLILLLNERRCHLLDTLSDKCEEIRDNLEARNKIDKEIVETRIMIEKQLKHNMLQSLQTRMVAETENKQEKLHHTAPPLQELRFLCNTKDLEECIACLGEITQQIPQNSPFVFPSPTTNDTHHINTSPSISSMPILHSTNETLPLSPNMPTSPIIPTKHSVPFPPNNPAYQQPSVAIAVVKQGSGPGELDKPRGVTIDTKSGHIYVADMNNSRINTFSQTGDYIIHFGDRHLKKPWGILIHQNDIYVTDTGHHAIMQYKLKDLSMKKRVGERGSGSEAFNSPKQLAISPNQAIYVADELNNRLQIMTTKLKFKGSLRHKNMNHPVDVKFLKNEIFVLSLIDGPCIHVFSLSGVLSRSFITAGKGMQVRGPYCFCLNEHKNIVISDYWANQITVFSPEGKFIHGIGQYGHEAGMFYYPTGVAMHKTKLICISSNKNFGLQIFST